MHPRPDWWAWPLEFTAYTRRRMEQRGVTEIDVRAMLEIAARIGRNHEPGRWAAHTTHDGAPWRVILEPQLDEHVTVVVTVYPVRVVS
ncbi:MAG: DUF4258 domain-containing protein [Phycisphaerales bacterium]